MTALSWLVGGGVLVVFVAPEFVQHTLRRVHRWSRKFLREQE